MNTTLQELRSFRPTTREIVFAAVFAFFVACLAMMSFEPPAQPWAIVVILLSLAGFATIPLITRAPMLGFASATVLMLLSFAFGSGAEATLVALALFSAGSSISPKAAWQRFGVTAASGTASAGILALRLHTSTPAVWGMDSPAGSRDAGWDFINCALIIVGVALVVTLVAVNLPDREPRYKRDDAPEGTGTPQPQVAPTRGAPSPTKTMVISRDA